MLTRIGKSMSSTPDIANTVDVGARGKRDTVKLGVVVACLPVAVAFSLLGPQGLTWLPLVLVGVMLVMFRHQLALSALLADVQAARNVLFLFLAFMVWSVARALWSPNVIQAITAVFWFQFCAVIGVIGCLVARRPLAGGRWRWSYFPIVASISALLLILAVTRIVDLSGLAGERLTHDWHFNRAALLIALMLPVSLFAVGREQGPPWRKMAAGVATTALVAAAIFASQSESAKLALLLVVSVHLATLINLRWSGWLLLAAFVAFMVAKPQLIGQFDEILTATGIGSGRQLTYGERIRIWQGVLPYIQNAPWFGNGVEYVRDAGHVLVETGQHALSNHPHSFILQTWVDLGFVGIVLLAAFSCSVMLLILRQPPPAARMYLSMLIAAFGIWDVSHGMWQSWFVGLCAIVAIFAVLCDNRARWEAVARRPER
jgi:O-antigen ligase